MEKLDLSYKNHIQSLRAISVLLVFFYHLNFHYFSKGYLGVDIFFVISGFVITQRIYKDLEIHNKFHLISFYKRRIKRIVPNLIFIISATYLIYLFFGPPNITLWKDTMSAFFGISNLFFLYSNQDYFYNIQNNPLAHTWSLGVEEQFYLIFPFIIYIVFNFLNKKVFFLIAIITLLFAISLSSAIYFQNILPNYIFYFPFFRFWEFCVGSILFLLSDKINKNKKIFTLSILIVLGVFIFGNNLQYLTGNIIAVFLSAIFICIYKDGFLSNNRYILSLGKISYSFYLWHLPVIYFLSLYLSNKIYLTIFSFFISYIFSVTTYQYIEKFFQEYNYKKFKFYIHVIFLLLFLILILIYIKYFNENLRNKIRNLIYQTNYLQKNYNWNDRVIFQSIVLNKNKIHDFCTDHSETFTINRDGLKNECLKHQDYTILFYLEGNSHTAQYVTAFDELEIIKNLYFKSYITSDEMRVSADEINKLSKKYQKIFYITDVSNIELLNKLKKEIPKIDKEIEIILFNSTPFSVNIEPLKCLIQKNDCFSSKEADLKRRDLRKLNTELIILKKNHKNLNIFNSYDILCPEKNCPIYKKEKDILYYIDNNHLSMEGSRQLKDGLLKFFKKQYSDLKF